MESLLAFLPPVVIIGAGLMLLWARGRIVQQEARHAAEVAYLKEKLNWCTPSEFVLRDVVATWNKADESEHLVLVKFRTLAGQSDFFQWLRREHTDANRRERNEAAVNGQGKSAPGLNPKHI